jgi:hypothetical protein
VNDIEDGFVLENAFQVVTEYKVWTFFAKTPEEKKEWVTKINKSIEQLKHVPSLQGAQNAPLYAPLPSSKLSSFLSPKTLENMLPYDQNPKVHKLPSTTDVVTRASPTARKDSGLSKLLLKFQQKQKKKVELNQLNGTIDSDDEEEVETPSAAAALKPFMDDANYRLVEKQRHLQLVNILTKEQNEVAPLIKQLVDEDFEMIVQSPLYGVRANVQQTNWRVSIEVELKDKHKGDEADFNQFISAFRGSISITPTQLSPESTTQNKRKSRFFFL